MGESVTSSTFQDFFRGRAVRLTLLTASSAVPPSSVVRAPAAAAAAAAVVINGGKVGITAAVVPAPNMEICPLCKIRKTRV